MILKRITIKKYGNLQDKTLEFSPGINVLHGENADEKNTIYKFIKNMLYGFEPFSVQDEEGENCGGTIWFESQGKNYRLTREFSADNPICELFCEEDQNVLDVKQGALDRILGKVSLAVFEDTVWAVQPVNALGRDLAKEIQNYMKRFLKSADRHLDLGRAGQMLKMWRKGYQSQKEKYQRETRNEQEKLSEKMEQLESGLDRLREQQGEFAEKSEKFFSPGQESTKDQMEEKIRTVQNKNTGMIVASALALIVGLVGLVGRFQVTDEMSRMGMDICLIAAIITVIYTTAMRRKLQMELAKLKKQRVRFLAGQEKLKWNKENLELAYREKLTDFTNLQNEYKDYETEASLPTSYDMEIQALNMAVETIEELSRRSRIQVGRKLRLQTSLVFQKLTAGKYTELLTDEDFHITVVSADGEVPLERMKGDVIRLVYLAVHVAAGELMCKEEKFPLILGDFFEMSEEKGITPALHWLNGQSRQVLLGANTEKEIKILEKEKIKYQKIRL